MSNVKKGTYSQQLKDKFKDLKIFSSQEPTQKGFGFKDLNDFIKRSEEVRKTFKDEDLIRFNSSN